MRPVGIFGGTFDPPHIGHLRTALELYQELGLAEVRLIPSHQPPHRPAPFASPEQRLAMLNAAVGDQPGLRVDECELRRSGRSYTVDTLASLRAEVGATPLALIVGWDAFLTFDTWHRWREICELAHLIVVQRPASGFRPVGELAALLDNRRVEDPGRLASRPSGLVLTQRVTQLDISATAIRAQIAAGKSVRYLLPDAVCSYIGKHRLYAGPHTRHIDDEVDTP